MAVTRFAIGILLRRYSSRAPPESRSVSLRYWQRRNRMRRRALRRCCLRRRLRNRARWRRYSCRAGLGRRCRLRFHALLGRLQFGEVLRQLFLLGDELCLFGCELIQLLLSSGKLFLLGGELLNTASHGGQVLRHRIKLLRQFWRWGR